MYAASIGVELPRHHQDADDRRDEATGHVGDAAWRQAREVVGRRHDVAAMFVVSCASMTMSAPKMITGGLPMRAMRATGSQIASPKTTIVALVTATPMNANAVIVAGQAERLPERLRSLAACVASEVRDVQAQRRPVADVCRHAGGKELPERRGARSAGAPIRSGCGASRHRG